MDQHPDTSLSYALHLDQSNPLQGFRNQFYFPQFEGRDAIYFCGNSLGLQSRNTEGAIKQELEDWRNLGVGGYMRAKNPWLFYQDNFREPLSRIMGCQPREITLMNTLTVNLHLMLLSFYRPTPQRYKIMMEAGAFPSDQYAIETQVKFHGLDPAQAIIEILSSIQENGESLALVLFGGINYYTGQLFDIKSITQTAHRAGALAGFDLAHAAANVAMELHDWQVDFAVWCSYKYLNGGPGAAGGVFVHERFATDPQFPRLAGWWGNDEKTRFNMEKGFVPKADASGWNISTAQVFNMVCLKASLELFNQAGMDQISKTSRKLTGYLEYLLGELSNLPFDIITPSEPSRRGAQLSLYFPERGREIHQKMTESGIIVDYREPGVIRVAPAPLYNSFGDVHRFYEILKQMQP